MCSFLAFHRCMIGPFFCLPGLYSFRLDFNYVVAFFGFLNLRSEGSGCIAKSAKIRTNGWAGKTFVNIYEWELEWLCTTFRINASFDTWCEILRATLRVERRKAWICRIRDIKHGISKSDCGLLGLGSQLTGKVFFIRVVSCCSW